MFEILKAKHRFLIITTCKYTITLIFGVLIERMINNNFILYFEVYWIRILNYVEYLMRCYFTFVNARSSDKFYSNICLVRVNRIDSSCVAVNTVTVASRYKVRKANSSGGWKWSGNGGLKKISYFSLNLHI